MSISLREWLPPVVIKSRRSSGGAGVYVKVAFNLGQFIKCYRDISFLKSVAGIDIFEKPVVQEYIPGKTHDYLGMFNKGVLRACLTRVREVTYPLYAGTGAVNRTTDFNELKELRTKLLTCAGYHGAAQLETKLDPRDGRFKLIEINPKLWGTLDLSI